MGQRESAYRLWWLITEEDQDRSYVLKAYVTTERDVDANAPTFESTIAGMEGRLVASGDTSEEAESNAMQLLHDMLMDAIESNSLNDTFKDVGRSFTWKLTNVPFQKMVDMIQEMVSATSDSAPKPTVTRSTWQAGPVTAAAEVCV